MFAGIDLGSRKVKIAVLNNRREIIYKNQFDTISFYRHYGRKEGDQLLIDFSQLGMPSFDKIVSTGYGRLTVKLKGAKVIPELKAHLLGAVEQTKLTDFTLIDLGGQDSKIIKVRQGKMVDFQTNDRCAASSGRYLENMAKVLGISIDELANHSEDPVDLSSTCAVFGESELIGKIIEGYSVGSLAAGVNYTIFRRIQPMLVKAMSPVIIFTGGVAYNQGLQEIIKKETGAQLVVPQWPEYNGAIGCAVMDI